MTKLPTGVRGRAVDGPRCRWCRRVLPEQVGAGRKRVFCSQPCRQWDWVARQRARELKISEDELVIARAVIDSLYDDLYVLACAVDDTERELKAGKPTVRSMTEALEWMMEAARPLRDRTLTPQDE
ncbi:MAG: hypothetical protein JHD22_03500 [Ilumatobacteraceae bacterium]|nr:hypothetical protein [Ilumatobacteraceae bacterium]